MPPPIPPAPAALAPVQMRELADAQLAMRKIRRAAALATFDAWTIALFAGLSCLCGISSIRSLLVGLGMAAVAYIEFRGAADLRRLDAGACRRLAINQLALAAILILYALASLWVELPGQGIMQAMQGVDPAAARMLKDVEGLAKLVVILVYGALIAVAVFGQGSMALYYHTRRRIIQAYLDRTPSWIIQMQRSGIAL